MENTLITLAEFHYELGYIGYDEFHERVQVALWLADRGDGVDPRFDSEEESYPSDDENDGDPSESVICPRSSSEKNSDEDEDNLFQFICLGIWVFTKSDQDSYPSIPHGHYQDQNRPWPKLNPYTGRVFSSKHQEEKTKRLSKKAMRNIWQDESFKSFCREMIVWYKEQFPYYEFSVHRPLRMPRW
jgi:hypothetical protein